MGEKQCMEKLKRESESHCQHWPATVTKATTCVARKSPGPKFKSFAQSAQFRAGILNMNIQRLVAQTCCRLTGSAAEGLQAKASDV